MKSSHRSRRGICENTVSKEQEEKGMKRKGRKALLGAFCVVAFVLVFQFTSEGRWLQPSSLSNGIKFASVQEKVDTATVKEPSLSRNASEAVHLRGPKYQTTDEDAGENDTRQQRDAVAQRQTKKKETQDNSLDHNDSFLNQDVEESIESSSQDSDKRHDNYSDDGEIDGNDSDEESYYDENGEQEDEPYNTNNEEAGGDEDDDGYTTSSDTVVSKQPCNDWQAGVAVTATLSNYTRNHFLNNLVNITKRAKEGDVSSSKAVCRFSTAGNYLHFPHVMQSYTRCFSFFRRNADRTPVIVKRRNPRFRDTFNLGIFDIFRYVFNGTIVHEHKFKKSHYRTAVIAETVVEVNVREEPDQQGIAFQNPKHAEFLRQKTAEYYHMETEGCKIGKENPVIGILNRNSTRTLLNAHELQEKLSNLTDKPVDIVYFDGKTFHEQISFMMQTDIIISPHGAQLSSINFMGECGGVFEIFPPGYFWPHFFGPLAASSGLFHGYVYTGEDLEKEWYQAGAHDPVARRRGRSVDVCAPLEASMDVIGKLIENWKSCCREKLADDSPSAASLASS
uniref:Glycosyltransferase 61 catalytic domain-containing protein n=1 Tax=Amphora coffeiformis TaxID=265554 RepID=A0A7S3L7K8_9STRA